MASGKKNYFRHSFFARNDEIILELMDRFSFKGYFFWFALLEICGEQSADGYKEVYKFHQSRLYRELRCNKRSLEPVLDFLQTSTRLVWNKSDNYYKISIPNFPKYLGKYTNKSNPNGSNKIKEKEIKEKERKGKEIKKIKNKKKDFELEFKLIESWNSLGIIKHEASENNCKKILQSLKAKLEIYKLEEILTAMKNYAQVLDSDAWFTYKWPLWDFLKREGADKFYPDQFVLENFLNKSRADQKIDAVKSWDNPYL